MKTRTLQQRETQTAVDLAWSVFAEFEAPDYKIEGVNTFRAFLDDEAMINQLKIVGKFDEDKLIGFVATRGDCHICMFFVKKEYHRQGVGRSLFEYVIQNCACDKITVNSSPYAIAFYHSLGFVDTNTEQLKDGIRFTPMVFTFH